MTATPMGRTIPERTLDLVASHIGRPGPLLPILHDLHGEFGYLPEEALRTVADRLNISRAEVHGVASFYHDFRHAPAGRHVLRICRAEACQSVGADRLVDYATSRLGIGVGETTADSAVTLEAVYCLGLCACGPAAMVDGKVAARLDEEKLGSLISECGR